MTQQLMMVVVFAFAGETLKVIRDSHRRGHISRDDLGCRDTLVRIFDRVTAEKLDITCTTSMRLRDKFVSHWDDDVIGCFLDRHVIGQAKPAPFLETWGSRKMADSSFLWARSAIMLDLLNVHDLNHADIDLTTLENSIGKELVSLHQLLGDIYKLLSFMIERLIRGCGLDVRVDYKA